MAIFTIFVAIFSVSSAYAQRDVRIVGGQEALLGECPYQVSIRMGDNHVCSGSIIDNRTIITAASCVDGMNPEKLKIVLGTNALIGGGKNHTVTGIYKHALYNPQTIQYDLASMKIEPWIEFNKFAQSVEITQEEVEEGQQIKASGWGMTSQPGSLSNNLQTLKMKVISVEECSERLQVSTVDAKVVCGMPSEGKGMCFGDSGSPVVNSQKQLIGIVSWGVPCAQGMPEVFTSAYFFKDWIEEHKDQ